MSLVMMRLVAVALLALVASPAIGGTIDSRHDVKHRVDAAVRQVMTRYHVPGMAVGVIADGKSYVFNYGIASMATHRPVTADTLFEIGSVSKTFTATLASYAQARCGLSLSDQVGTYLPQLRDRPFGGTSLLNLGTHTPGGLPLQVPDEVRNNDQLMRYLKAWKPEYAPGTMRTYNNIGIGVLGLITARCLGRDFRALLERRLFPALGMEHSFIDVPISRMDDYAQGYTKNGTPIRMARGVLAAEAYGIKTTAADMLRFVAANMALIPLDAKLQRAITETHTGYFNAGVMMQDLIWEQYAYPVTLKSLLAGNSPVMIFDATPVSRITPAQKPAKSVWINKTGSTNGFSAYVAFIPEKRLGIVILANQSFPIDARVTAAFEILTSLH